MRRSISGRRLKGTYRLKDVRKKTAEKRKIKKRRRRRQMRPLVLSRNCKIPTFRSKEGHLSGVKFYKL